MNKKIFVVIVIIYRFLLDLIYKFEIAPIFAYANLDDNSTKDSLVMSWILLALLLPFVLWSIDQTRNIFGSMVCMLFFMIRVVPFTSTMLFNPQDTNYIVINVAYWILLFTLLLTLKPKKIGIGNKYGNSNAISIITIISIATVLIVSGVYAHFRIHLSLEDVYELRDEARGYNLPLLLAYLHPATSNVIPILLVYYISKEKKALVYLLIFIGILNFSIAGHKSTLFKILFCVGLYYGKNLNLKKILPYCFVGLTAMVLGQFILFNDNFLSTLIVRRVFYVPNILDTLYYEYINTHGPVYFDTKGLAFSIGAEYYGSDDMRANNGLFTDAYINLGTIGCFIYPFIIAFFEKTFESITEGKENCIVVFAALIFVTTLGSSLFTTSLLTHGLFFIWLTMMSIPKSYNTIIYDNENFTNSQ